MYSHSSAFGCQCIALRPPGLIVTRAAAIVFETKKLVLSAVCTIPLFVSRTGISASLNIYGFGGFSVPAVICASTSESGGARRLLW